MVLKLLGRMASDALIHPAVTSVSDVYVVSSCGGSGQSHTVVAASRALCALTFSLFSVSIRRLCRQFLYHYVRRDMLLPVVSSICAFYAFLYCFSTVELLRFLLMDGCCRGRVQLCETPC